MGIGLRHGGSHEACWKHLGAMGIGSIRMKTTEVGWTKHCAGLRISVGRSFSFTFSGGDHGRTVDWPHADLWGWDWCRRSCVAADYSC